MLWRQWTSHKIRGLPSVPGGSRIVSGAFSVYSKMNEVGLGCLEAVWATRCDNFVMKTQRKTEIGKLHIASFQTSSS